MQSGWASSTASGRRCRGRWPARPRRAPPGWPAAVVIAVAFHEVRGVDAVWHMPVSVIVVAAIGATLLTLRLPLRDHLPGGRSAAAVALVAGALAAFVANWGPTVARSAWRGPYRSPPAYETVRTTPGAATFFRR